MSANVKVFAVLFLVALALFGLSCFRRFRLLTLGRPENRFDNLGRRIWSMLYYPFAQRCTVTRGYLFGLNHAVFFWSFIILLISGAEFLLSGLFPDYISLSRLPAAAYHTLSFIFDVVWAVALGCVVVALIRRLAFRPSYILPVQLDALITLSLFLILLVAFYGRHASEIAQGTQSAARYMPISNFVASTFLSGLAVGNLTGYASAFWWVFAIAALGFINYLGVTKHMHILTAIPNCFFRSLEKVNTQPREEFKIGNSFGVGQIDQFTWKNLFDAYACTDCGRCSDACPATFTGKPLDPQKVIHDIKANLLRNGPQLMKKKDPLLPLIGSGQSGSVAEEVIWECTTCGACVEVCPVFIEHFPRIIDLRRYLVEMEARLPEELLSFFENMEWRGNPWGIDPGERRKWAMEIEVKPFAAGRTEYLFFVGCAGAFDARNRPTTLSLAEILSAAGVSWGILEEEKCCGDSLRRLGNEYVFDRIVEQNLKIFAAKGVKKVITQCPHCYNTLKNDYPQYGVELEVRHHTEFINNLLKEGRLKLTETRDRGKVVFHDSCYLGRYNDIYQEPRQVIASATGQLPAEMERCRNRSFCCGAGGGRIWMKEAIGKRINVARVEEALAQNPRTICVSCPYCKIMFEDGLKDKNADDRVQVLDLAEIVARALK